MHNSSPIFTEETFKIKLILMSYPIPLHDPNSGNVTESN